MNKISITITEGMLNKRIGSIINIINLANSFKSDILLAVGENVFQVKSIMSFALFLHFKPDIKEIVLTAEGPDEDEAVWAIKKAITTKIT
jgi:phosphotransferase system HPr-like phosphotransfer protein